MARPTGKASKAERDLQAYSAELGIRHHAERLEAASGPERALQILEEVSLAIAARRPSSVTVAKPAHK